MLRGKEQILSFQTKLLRRNWQILRFNKKSNCAGVCGCILSDLRLLSCRIFHVEFGFRLDHSLVSVYPEHKLHYLLFVKLYCQSAAFIMNLHKSVRLNDLTMCSLRASYLSLNWELRIIVIHKLKHLIKRESGPKHSSWLSTTIKTHFNSCSEVLKGTLRKHMLIWIWLTHRQINTEHVLGFERRLHV